MKKTISLSLWAYILVVGICAGMKLGDHPYVYGSVIRSDVTHYYAYLPTFFIHRDPNFKTHTPPYEIKTPTGGYIIKTSMGLAYLYLPFFGIGHLEAKYCGKPTDGYSMPYQRWLYFSGLVYFCLGLWFLRKYLQIFFSDSIVALTLVILTLATNLTYYTAYESAMSHVYTFSLFSILIYLWHKWQTEPKVWSTLSIGFLMGLIVLIRPVNLLFGLFLFFYGITLSEVPKRITFLWQRRKHIIAMGLAALSVWIPQMYFWYINTGQLLYYTYENERFFFLNPQILNGLWSYRKGWLIYTPIMHITLLAIPFFYYRMRNFFWGYTLTFVVYVYVIFSWWSWWYGGSYGSRPMIDLYPMLALGVALPLQVAKEKLSSRARKIFWPIVLVLIIGFIYWNLTSIRYYRKAYLHWDSMTRAAYWELFGKPGLPNPETYQKLLKEPDYEKALRGEDEYP